MGKLKFGVSSIVLGKEQKTENLRYDSVEWGEATTIQDFFRAGGNPSSVTPTRCKFLYTAEKLFVLFENMEEKAHHILKEENTVTELTVKRKDQVEVALSGKEFSRRDFAVFTAKRDGSNSAFVEKGMTYLSGDQAYLGEGKDQGEKTAISKEQYSVTVDILQDRWYALFAIPWMLFGGKPEKEKSFDLQVYRKKHQSSEVLCPTPLDLNVNYSDRFEYDPETFLEVSFGEKGETKTENGIVFVMPSGICHWQRPGVLEKTSTEERKEIYQLQKSVEPTTRENLTDRIRIAQRWQDSLTLEGFDFFFNQEVANPWKPMDPWVEKRLVNERLRENRWEEAAAELDRYLTFLRTCSAWWYADHSFGNQDLEKWTSCSEIGHVLETKDHVTICVESKERTWELMIYPVVGGFRMISGKKGFFDGQPEAFSVEESEHAYIIRSKEHEMILQKETLEISIDRKAITNLKNISFIFEKESVSASRIQFSIHENSAIYGFGERFDSVNQYGKTVALWQRDACEGCLASIGNQAYKNIPLVHTSDGFSFFANTSYRMRMDVGDAVQDYLSVEALGDVFDFYIWSGTPREAMTAYGTLTGLPIFPPEWVFEPWAGGGGGRWRNGPLQDIALEQMAAMKKFHELDIPHSGFYAEGAGATFFGEYKKEELYKVVSFGERHGFKVFSWQFPNMTQELAQELLPECPKEELPITRNKNDEEEKLPVYIDFSHPRAKELLAAQWKDRLDAGIRGSMVDFGDVVPDEAVFYDGRRGDEMHNAYAYQYAKNYRELFEQKYGDDHVLYTRGAAPGSQHFACQFGGDQLTSFQGLKYAIAGGLSAAASGLPFWGVDAGGYDGFPDQETYLRWTEYAAFCPLMRFHGTEPREPWEYDAFTVKVYRYYTWLRENLRPYIVSVAAEAHKLGIPMMRPLAMMYPEDQEATKVWDEYLFGEDLLVAPVSDETEEREIYFPEGRWISLWNLNDEISGPVQRSVEVPIDKIPVYVREGSFLPLRLNENLKLGESMSESETEMILAVVPQNDSIVKETLYERSGAKTCCDMKKNGETIQLQISGKPVELYVMMAGIHWKNTEAIVNGRTLTKVTAREGLYFTEGYLELEEGILVKINPSAESVIKIQKK